MNTIIYLHGFRSAPASSKARALHDFLAARGHADAFWCEQLPVSPAAALALIDAAVRRVQDAGGTPTLVGSSLGGFYATCTAERHGLRAVLINPAVLPSLRLDHFLGTQTHLYSGEAFEFTRTHADELSAAEVTRISQPERYWLLAEEGDEVLDYRAAVRHYAGARQTVLPGGDHSFTRWPDYLEAVATYAGLT